MRARLHQQRGFTLLEVIIGLALLGLALTVLIKSAAGNIFNSEQAHMMGVATDLARAKMYDIEEMLLKDGFTDTDQSQNDEKCFEDEGWPTICYTYKVEEPKMPSYDELQQMAQGQAKAGSAMGSAMVGSDGEPVGGFENSTLGGMIGMMGAFGGGKQDIDAAQGGALIQNQYSMFQEILKVSVRKVTLNMKWKVLGSDRDMKIVAFFTDAAAMDKVLSGMGSTEITDTGTGSGSGSGSGSGNASAATRLARKRGDPAMRSATAKVRRNPEAGLTLFEVMIASAVMVIMMTLAWRTIANTSDSRRTFTKYQERNHEIRMALGRAVADFEGAYLSRNEDMSATNPRTMFIAKSGSKIPEIRFSTLGHRVLWSDANESEQTVIQYLSHNSKENPGQVDWVRAERRRPSNLPPDEEPAEYDVLVRNIEKLELEFWNWKNLEWQDTWDTTQTDGQKGWLPSRVKITIKIKSPDGERDLKLISQARIILQEPLLANP